MTHSSEENFHTFQPHQTMAILSANLLCVCRVLHSPLDDVASFVLRASCLQMCSLPSPSSGGWGAHHFSCLDRISQGPEPGFSSP